jgi:hypothetical protein
MQAWGSQAFGEQDFWGLISCMGFRKHRSVALLLALESQACRQREFWGLISHMGLRRAVQWHAARGSEPAGLCLLLPVEQWKLLFTQGLQFSWCFRVKVASHVAGGSMKLQVPVCAGKQELLPSILLNRAWSCAATLEARDQEC